MEQSIVSTYNKLKSLFSSKEKPMNHATPFTFQQPLEKSEVNLNGGYIPECDAEAKLASSSSEQEKIMLPKNCFHLPGPRKRSVWTAGLIDPNQLPWDGIP